MTSPRIFCSTASEARNEPLLGTASQVTDWLLLEQPGPWGYDATLDSGLALEISGPLVTRVRELGIRLVFIRRRDTRRPRRRHVYFVHTGATASFVEHGRVEDPAELLDADLSLLPRGQHVGLGTVETDPVYLVCTHGRHDVCCSIRGWPLAKLLCSRMPGRAWECSHIGGDRFAGNVVCLPRGVYFGRLGPNNVLGVVEDYERGIIDLDHYRGRSCFPTAIQAAEHFVRGREALAGIDDVVLETWEGLDPSTAAVWFALPEGRRAEVVVRVKRDKDPVVLTCQATRPSRPRRFELVSISRLPT
ncbi:MAG: sucrase ferredoxin [Actinobacteria bacterium]|nr:sucrase ferredoxin [Actinomycetota bacterium]